MATGQDSPSTGRLATGDGEWRWNLGAQLSLSEMRLFLDFWGAAAEGSTGIQKPLGKSGQQMAQAYKTPDCWRRQIRAAPLGDSPLGPTQTWGQVDTRKPSCTQAKVSSWGPAVLFVVAA